MPSIDFIEYTPRQPSNVDAIQITTENIDDVAKLVGGRVERISKASDTSDVHVHLIVPHIDGPFRIDPGWYLTRDKESGGYGKETPGIFEDGWAATHEPYPFPARQINRLPDLHNPLVTSVAERTNRG